MGSVAWVPYPGTSMILPILLLAAGVLTTPVTNIEDKNEAVLNVNDRAGTMTSKVKQTIKVKKKKFKCTIILVHDNRRVNLGESELECTPGKLQPASPFSAPPFPVQVGIAPVGRQIEAPG